MTLNIIMQFTCLYLVCFNEHCFKTDLLTLSSVRALLQSPCNVAGMQSYGIRSSCNLYACAPSLCIDS